MNGAPWQEQGEPARRGCAARLSVVHGTHTPYVRLRALPAGAGAGSAHGSASQNGRGPFPMATPTGTAAGGDEGGWDDSGLRGQRDLPHAAGRGRPGRARGRVLPLRRVQPVVRARGRPRGGGLPVLRHRLRRAWTGRAADASPTPPPSPAPSRRPGRAGPDNRYVVFTGGEPLLQLDAPLIEAVHAAGVRDRHRDERHAARRRPGSTGSASARRDATPSRRSTGDELKLVYPQDDARSGGFRRPGLPPPLPPAHGWAGPDRQHARRRSRIAGAMPAGVCRCRPTR